MLFTFGVLGLALLAVSAAGSSQLQDRDASTITWADATSKARANVAQMTLEEMNDLVVAETLTGTDYGLYGSKNKFGFPGYLPSDGPAGVRNLDLVNAFPAGASIAASWNTGLANQRGNFMGAEFRAKGFNVAFAPVVGPIGRIATGGRNWEGFGADPYLAGKLGAATVEGMQKHIVANIKHFVGNEQETARSPAGSPTAMSSNIDDQTMHEVYMWPFQDTVRAGVGSVMCSYNRINGSYACANGHVLSTLLKGELAFPGFVISDFLAAHAGIPDAAAGLDLILGVQAKWENGTLAKAITDGKFVRSRLEDMATRVLASWYKLLEQDKVFPAPGLALSNGPLAPHAVIDARDPASRPNRLQGAIEGHVLVKNTKNALPLKKPLFLSLYGYDARVAPVNYPEPASSAGLQNGAFVFGTQSVNTSGADISAAVAGAPIKDPPSIAALGTLITGGGSGSGTTGTVVDPFTALIQRAQEDDTYVLWDFQSPTPLVSPLSSACMVFINDLGEEGLDRPDLTDAASDKLVTSVAANCTNTIVVAHNNGIRVVDAWIDHPNVTAVLLAHTPGQLSGTALVDILYGSISPSGRLPYTIPKNGSDFGSLLEPCPATPKDNPVCVFSEKGNIDYKHFLANDIEPRFPFGYGLTYSNFSYSHISAAFASANLPASPPNPQTTAPGGTTSLFDTVATVSATITNTGKVDAAEVAQLYVQFPEEKVRTLRGFNKTSVAPGMSAPVQFALTRRDLSRWDVLSQSWMLPSGTYRIFVGPNVQDNPLTAELSR